MQEKIMKFEKMLERELETELDKIEQTGTISPDNICVMKDAFKLMKLMKEYDGQSEDGYSNRRGRSRMTGRYVSRDSGSYEGGSSNRGSFGSYDGSSGRGSYRGGYSGHGKMIEQLERMYDSAEDEKERQMIDEWIRKAEQGQ